MNTRGTLIVIAVLLSSILILLNILPDHKAVISIYDGFVFYPIQSFRGFLLGKIPFSIGDVLYLAGGVLLLRTIVNWIQFIARFSEKRAQLFSSLLRSLITALVLYLFFLFGWGINYYKTPLGKSWDLYVQYNTNTQRRIVDSILLTEFNKYLVNQLNRYASGYHHANFDDINITAMSLYRKHTDSKVSAYGLAVKPTFFNYFIRRTGVEGYYNPFTGEGQIDASLPCFLLPFVTMHEMAHQAGIAAEGDANLMAYAVGTSTDDSLFRYSSYLNIWLYANNRLYRRDSALAKTFERQLNELTIRHLDTIDQLSRLYNNDIARYSSSLFDDYLKLQDQKEGIKSYGNVVSSAWQLEQKRDSGYFKTINIP